MSRYGQADDGQPSKKAAKWTDDMGAHLADFGQAEELPGKNKSAKKPVEEASSPETPYPVPALSGEPNRVISRNSRANIYQNSRQRISPAVLETAANTSRCEKRPGAVLLLKAGNLKGCHEGATEVRLMTQLVLKGRGQMAHASPRLRSPLATCLATALAAAALVTPSVVIITGDMKAVAEVCGQSRGCRADRVQRR
jgi:hypothetical protein